MPLRTQANLGFGDKVVSEVKPSGGRWESYSCTKM